VTGAMASAAIRVSVWMATYNGERFIEPQLESILTQLGREDELIVSDDGSTDGLLRAIRCFGDSRVRSSNQRGGARPSIPARLWLVPREDSSSFRTRTTADCLVTPPLLYVFRSFRRRDLLTVGIWIGAASSILLLLLFMGTGCYGFGDRYVLDLIPLAILLIAIGMNGRLSRPALVLIGFVPHPVP